MANNYEIRYLPLFYQDFIEVLDYIKYKLNNPEAAEKLIIDVEEAILNRMNNPESFEIFRSIRERKYPYYRIYFRNFVIFYVVIDDDLRDKNPDDSKTKIVEIRRILYNKSDYKERL